MKQSKANLVTDILEPHSEKTEDTNLPFLRFWLRILPLVVFILISQTVSSNAQAVRCEGIFSDKAVPTKADIQNYLKTAAEIITRLKLRTEGNSLGPIRDAKVGNLLDELSKFGLVEITSFGGKTYRSSKEAHDCGVYFYDLTINEVYSIATNIHFRNALANAIYKEASYGGQFMIAGFGLIRPGSLDLIKINQSLDLIARTILAKDYIDSKASARKFQKSFTEKEFLQLARIENFSVQKFSEAYRYDSRHPHQINQEGGFYPRPDMPIGPITMHSSPESAGAGYVSLSFTAENPYTVSIPQVILAANKVTAQQASQSLLAQELLVKKKQLATETPTELLLTYEYKVRDLLGIVPHSQSSVPQERELVVPFVDYSQVVDVREVWILAKDTQIKNFMNQVTGIKTEAADVKYGSWSSLP